MTMKCATITKGVMIFLWFAAGLVVVFQGALQYTSISGPAHPQLQNIGKRRAGATASNAYARAAEPGKTGSYSSSYTSANNRYTEGVGRGALFGGALAAALTSCMHIIASLPIVPVTLVAAMSVGLIGRDYLTYRRSGRGFEITNTPKMVLGLLFIIIGGNLAGAGNPGLLAIASGAAAIGFLLKSQTQHLWQSSAPAGLPYRSTLSNTASAKRTNITWSTWRSVSGSEWMPGQPGQNNWQRDQWYTRPKVR